MLKCVYAAYGYLASDGDGDRNDKVGAENDVIVVEQGDELL